MTIFVVESLPLWRDALFRLRLPRSASRFIRTGQTTPSCEGHSLRRDKVANVTGEALEADFGFCASSANRPYDPTGRRGLLSAKHVFDASPKLALFAVCILPRISIADDCGSRADESDCASRVP